METINNIVTTLGGYSIFAVTLGFLLKSLFKQMLDKDIVQFRTELLKVSEKEMESLKAELQKSIDVNATRYSILHSERSKYLTDIFTKLYEVKVRAEVIWNLMDIPSNEKQISPTMKTIIDDSYEEWVSLSNLIGKCYLYLNKDLSEKIETITGEYAKPICTSKLVAESCEPTEEQLARINERLPSDTLNTLLNEIEDEFRELLGSKMD